MSIRFFSGFETGDISEWINHNSTFTIDSTIVRGGGGYSLSFPWDNGNHYIYYNAFNPQPSSAYLRFGFYTTAAGGATVAWIAEFNHSGSTIGAIRLATDGGGGIFLRLFNNITGTQIGSDYQIQPSNWYLVHLKLVTSASAGVLEMKVNGVVVATGSGLNTGSNTVDALQIANQNISGTGATGNIWFDDIMVDDAQYPANGYCIARQGNTTAPTYNSWTKTGGTNIWQVWDSTPFSAGSNASTATFGNEQTMVVDFTTVGATGSTGHGTGNVGSWDLINAFKVAGIGKTSSTTSDGTDSTVFRTPAGGGGADTVTGLPSAWTTTDSYQEVIIATPTLAQVQSCEIGFSKGTGSNTHTIEDAWAMVDFLPIPYSMFQGSETEPYTPLSFENLVEDGGEEAAWYPITTIDNAAILLSQPLSILIIDAPSRSYGEASENDYFTPSDADISTLFFVVQPPTIIANIASQWDNSTVPLDNEELIEEQESDYYPDFGIDLSWFISFFVPSVTPFVFNEVILEPDLVDFTNSSLNSVFITAGLASPILVFSDYSPADVDQLLDDSGDGDFYPDFSIDVTWYFVQVTQATPQYVFNDYAPLETETIIEDDGSEPEWYPFEDSPLAWIILAIPVVIASSQWDNQTADYLEIYSEESDGDYYPDFDVDPSSFFGLIQPNISFYISASQWDNQSVDYLELYSEESEGDYYPDTSIDQAWYFAQVVPPIPLYLIFSDYSPLDFDEQTEPSETDYYPSREEELQWFISTLPTVNSLFGSWVFNALSGQLPTVQPTGGVELFGGGYGSVDWTPVAFTGSEALQVQTNFGGTLGYDSQIPSDNLAISGNELFTLYYSINDTVPDQIEIQLYESTTASWKIAYLGTDSFGLGGINKGGIPPTIGFWLSFTFTAADLGLVAGNIVTGLAWGVYNATTTSTVVFSDTLSIRTVTEDQVASSQWDNQFVDYLDLYNDDLGEGDYYPDFSIDNSATVQLPLNPILIFIDFAPDIYEDDISDEQAWYAPIDELLSWFIPPSVNENFIFNDYSPIELDQLIEDNEDSAWYPPFGNEVENWLFLLIPSLLIFVDYTPYDTTELTDDDGSEVSWYPSFGNELENWVFVQSVSSINIYVDYAPIDTNQLIEDDGSDQGWYPPFGNESENWSQILTTTIVVFGDYAPTDTEQLIEDEGSEQSWYPPFGSESENWSQIITTIIVVFGDYTPTDTEQLVEDSGDEQAWYPSFGNEVEDWVFIIPASAQILISASQWDNQAADALETYTDDLSDPDTYPDTSIDITWYFVQVQQLDISVVASIARVDDSGNQIPLSFELYIEDDGSEPIWYPIEGNIVVSLVPADIAYIITAAETYRQATDTPELQIEDSGEEQAWYPAQDDLTSWFIPPQQVTLLIFTDYSPNDSEQLVEDDGSEVGWYPPLEDILSTALFAQMLTDAFRLIDYTPIDTDQLIEDVGDEQAWYPAKEEELQWFISLQVNAFVIFNDYAPMDSEQLIEEQEGDYYPDFGVDPSPWSFVLSSGIAIIVVSGSMPETPDDQILDLGDEPAWYSVEGDILTFFIPIGIGILISSSQEYGKAADFLELYSEESEGDYYPPQDDTFSWFFTQILIITDFVFIEYNPLELEQLTEESEGDFYPDFGIDPAPWFASVQPAPTLFSAVIQWDAIPQEIEFLTEDLGEDISWFYPLDIVVVLIGFIKMQLNLPLTTTIQLYFSLGANGAATQIIYGN